MPKNEYEYNSMVCRKVQNLPYNVQRRIADEAAAYARRRCMEHGDWSGYQLIAHEHMNEAADAYLAGQGDE